jgi:Tfp pilus assembly protein PilV
MSGLFRNSGERGDTIVEVMISLIIISSVIVGAFILSRTSTRNIRSSEEHSQAQQLLQGQVELLRSYAAVQVQPGHPALPTSGNFCMDSSSGDYSTGSCNVVNSGGSYNYTLTVVQSKAGDAGTGRAPTYTFSVTWPSLDGTKNFESYVYRPALI